MGRQVIATEIYDGFKLRTGEAQALPSFEGRTGTYFYPGRFDEEELSK
jgi:hypothetical protein